jgi:hypothetical protein
MFKYQLNHARLRWLAVLLTSNNNKKQFNLNVTNVGVNNDSNVTVRLRRRITESTPVPDMTVGTGGSAGRRRLSTELDRNKYIVVEIFIHLFVITYFILSNITIISLLSLHYIIEHGNESR